MVKFADYVSKANPTSNFNWLTSLDIVDCIEIQTRDDIVYTRAYLGVHDAELDDEPKVPLVNNLDFDQELDFSLAPDLFLMPKDLENLDGSSLIEQFNACGIACVIEYDNTGDTLPNKVIVRHNSPEAMTLFRLSK